MFVLNVADIRLGLMRFKCRSILRFTLPSTTSKASLIVLAESLATKSEVLIIDTQTLQHIVLVPSTDFSGMKDTSHLVIILLKRNRAKLRRVSIASNS
jgi:Leu/Phe-tRNA-protein transferase